MYARVLTIALQPNHVAIFTEAMDKKVIPLLRKQTGFHEALTLIDQNGTDAISITLWDRKASADTYNQQTYPEALKLLAGTIVGTPHIKGYDVKNSANLKIDVPVAV
jgi:hypothetical protein